MTRDRLAAAHAAALRHAANPAFDDFERSCYEEAVRFLSRHLARGTMPRRDPWYYVPAF